MTTESPLQKEPTLSHPRVKIIRQPITKAPTLPPRRHDVFHHISQGISTKVGSPVALVLAVLLIVVWAISGPFLNFSNTWQLAINTTTTIVTFLMVFAIQNSQNRDSRAMQLKLDELLSSSRSAREEFVDIEDLSDAELEVLHSEFKVLHEKINSRVESKLEAQP